MQIVYKTDWNIVTTVAVYVVVISLAIACVPIYGHYLIGKLVIMGMATIGVQFLYVRCGELSFGHGLFFGVGAYTYALWGGTTSPIGLLFLLILSAVASATIAALLGFVIYRIRGVYFTLATVCAAEGARILFAGLYSLTNGDNGIQGIPVPGIMNATTAAAVSIVIISALVLLGIRLAADTMWGRRVDAQRQSEHKATALGLNVLSLRWQSLVFSSIPTGLAGGLLAMFERSVHPDVFGWRSSGELIAMMLLGGCQSAGGPFLGAAVLDAGKSLIASQWEHWQLVVGLVLLTCAIFWPQGITGQLSKIFQRFGKRGHA